MDFRYCCEHTAVGTNVCRHAQHIAATLRNAALRSMRTHSTIVCSTRSRETGYRRHSRKTAYATRVVPSKHGSHRNPR
ncbi:hypothetical protein NSERUTF1_2743 [Nocardia seriolae]|nr:hypothetical protein NSERUTF1_2743 [Nocardia seriolae]